MKYSVYDFGMLEKGRIVEVVLSSAANVCLLDSLNYNNYKNGRKFRYYGGLVKKSPHRFTVPSYGHWYLTIDLGGYSGSVKHRAYVLPGLLKPARENIPLVEDPNIVIRPAEEKKEFDVFISHASEDKESVVRPLANELVKQGVRVWFDEFELRIGDSLRRKIDQGLSNSRFGVVVISRAFIKKGWTNYELDGLITNSISGKQIILPIWHDITKQEVIDYSPSLADKVARSTGLETIQEIASEIASLVLQNDIT